jgi:hypothetical protein
LPYLTWNHSALHSSKYLPLYSSWPYISTIVLLSSLLDNFFFILPLQAQRTLWWNCSCSQTLLPKSYTSGHCIRGRKIALS